MRFARLALALAPFVPATAHARPEYAVRQNLSCVSCHVTPWGGGPRNVFGKTYGTRGLGTPPLTTNDLFYADVRAIAYFPDKAASRTNGLGIMEAAATVNAPISDPKSNTEIRGVLTYNIPTIGPTQLREAYLRWQNPGAGGVPATQLVLGRFYLPFGLLTDEHRTYTRVHSGATINNYTVGAGVARDWAPELHSDFALFQDLASNGSFVSGDIRWGSVANLRWQPSSLPFFLGTSGIYQYTLRQSDPYAVSGYFAFSTGRITDDRINAWWLFETVVGKNLAGSPLGSGAVNPGIEGFFIPPAQAAAFSAIARETSLSLASQIRYQISRQFDLIYRFDYFDPRLGGEFAQFRRHGLGFESHLSSNIILNARVEKASVSPAAFADSDVLAAQDDFFAMLRFWL